MRRYLNSVKKLFRNPKKVKYIPSFIKREFILERGLITKNIRGVSAKFNVTTISEYRRLKNFKDEQDIIRAIMEEVGTEDAFWDIGANIGTHSCFVGRQNNCQIYAFEPFSENAESLRKNFELNQINGEVFELALMNENSEMKIEAESGEAGEGKVHISDKGDVTIDVVKGDHLIKTRNLQTPNVIKIDIEGAELEVLKGLENTLENDKCRTLFIELHPDRIPKFSDQNESKILNLLTEYGFEVEKLDGKRREYHIWARR